MNKNIYVPPSLYSKATLQLTSSMKSYPITLAILLFSNSVLIPSSMLINVLTAL